MVFFPTTLRETLPFAWFTKIRVRNNDTIQVARPDGSFENLPTRSIYDYYPAYPPKLRIVGNAIKVVVEIHRPEAKL